MDQVTINPNVRQRKQMTEALKVFVETHEVEPNDLTFYVDLLIQLKTPTKTPKRSSHK